MRTRLSFRGPLRFITNVRQRLTVFYHAQKLRRTAAVPDTEYQDYLVSQLERTLPKNSQTLPTRAKAFIDLLGERITNRSVLCVGCRNGEELDYFRSKGALKATGVDLFSERPDILIMDMHDLKLQDHSYDLLYSSHSLEHAMDATKVIGEFIRVVRPGGIVAIEVPVNYPITAADRVDFGNVDGLVAAFGEAVESVLSAEHLSPRPEIGVGTETIRVILQLQ